MAEAALPESLHYVEDSQPGLRRSTLRGQFVYVDAQGRRIEDAATLDRIKALAIPPAYTDVWICADPQGHVQATGRDARGRKQYRYHPKWRDFRDSHKYARMLEFASTLPRIRSQLDSHLARPGLDRQKVMALIVSLLDATLIRVGNRQYARDNNSFGLTTLRNRHVKVQGIAIRFRFRGKSGIEHQVTLRNRRLANLIKRCMDLPGQDLFQYQDEQGNRHSIGSSDINAYLQELTGSDFTAKDYRTWAGSALALSLLRKLQWQPESEARRQVVEIVKQVALRLGNTPAVCRRCYIHPQLLEYFARGELANLPRARKRKGLDAEEVRLAVFLKSIPPP
ncbi:MULTISPECIES: DNA topoisomerase IB [Pseudomonas]|uniref:DNA topoisomerase n=1 Tax=Pseudomonas auratipiscis TaxID=3115853 RepID=A0AB35X0E6_9PSED|nr:MULTISPECIES: DNA topoisomerase IB [unclassified Pseudomonas]MEE1869129.1 DNA topoisomerase IB [Pseudomonas sp. 120P]MEE1959883.1 DNA topoisomerase IB [Pseudomonas sp. 119P]